MSDHETEAVALDAVQSAHHVDPLKWVRLDDHPQKVKAHVIAQAAAGAALTYAIYHATAETVLSLPDPVTRAYVKACAAYGIGAEYRVTDNADG